MAQRSISSYFSGSAKHDPSSRIERVTPGPLSREHASKDRNIVDLAHEDDDARTATDNETFKRAGVDHEAKFSMDYDPDEGRGNAFSKALRGNLNRTPPIESGSMEVSGDAFTLFEAEKSSKKAINAKYTPLEAQVVSLRQQNPTCLLMVECGYRMRFFAEDALIAAKVLHIYAHKDHSFQVASVPTHRFLVHARRLIAAGHCVGLVRQTETAAIRKAGKKSSSTTFERKVVAIYSPGTVVDDDDPRFSDLLNSTAAGGEGENENCPENVEDGSFEAAESDNFSEVNLSEGDTWLTSIAQAQNGDISIVSLSVRGHRLRHRTVRADPHGSDNKSMSQEAIDYLDLWRPVEVLLEDLSSTTGALVWDMLTSRSRGTVVMRSTVTSVSDSDTDITGEQYILRLCKVGGILGEVSSTLSDLTAESESLQKAVTLLERYLVPFGLVHSLEDVQLESDDPVGNTLVTGISSTAKAQAVPTTFKLDPVTASDLEVFAVSDDFEMRDGEKYDGLSLFAHINFCKSVFGRSTLASWLASPLRRLSDIQARQKSVLFLLSPESQSWYASVVNILSSQPDAERMITSLHHCRLSPKRTVLLLRWTIKACRAIKPSTEVLSSMPAYLQELVHSLGLDSLQSDVSEYLEKLDEKAAEADDAVNSLRLKLDLAQDENCRTARLAQLKREHAQSLHEMNSILENIRKFLKKPNLQYRTLHTAGAGVENLIEVEVKDCAPKGSIHIPTEWVQMNSTKSISRYHTPEILAEQGNLFRLRDEMKIAAKEAWTAFLRSLGAAVHLKLRTFCHVLGVIDALGSLSRVATMPGYTQPFFSDNESVDTGSSPADERFTIELEAARHPMAERLLEKENRQFQPNNLLIRGGHCARSCLVVTGPNMGGKSSYVRTAALVSLLGQIGSHVPAAQAKLQILDNIYTRMGADDDLARGRSTFLNELHRTSRIIRNASSRSLVILDELGRGTSTHDGVAIAIATLRYLVHRVGCATLFVTHYAQISDLVTSYSKEDDNRVANCHMGYIEEESKDSIPAITFLYNAVEGPSAGSYGLNTARVCGLDDNFLKLAVQASQWMSDRTGKAQHDIGSGEKRQYSSQDSAAAAPTSSRALVVDEAVVEAELTKKALQQLGQSPETKETEKIGMTKVKELVEAGDVSSAASILKRYPSLDGVIVHGEKRGRTIGYPTANLGEWSRNDLDTVPADGIYAGWLCLEALPESSKPLVNQPGRETAKIPSKGNHGFRKNPAADHTDTQYPIRFPAAISIGTNPTFDGERSRQVEAYVLNRVATTPEQPGWMDLYDRRARFEFGWFLRPTIKFGGASWLEDLLKQMESDCNRAAQLCASDRGK